MHNDAELLAWELLGWYLPESSEAEIIKAGRDLPYIDTRYIVEEIIRMAKKTNLLKDQARSVLAGLESLRSITDDLDYPEDPVLQYQAKRLRIDLDEAIDMIAARVALISAEESR